MDETRLNEISDVSKAINDIFIKRPQSSQPSNYWLNDTNELKNAHTIFQKFINASMIDLLYPSLPDFDQLNIYSSFISNLKPIDRINNTHYLMHSNYLLGCVIYTENGTLEGDLESIFYEIYSNLQDNELGMEIPEKEYKFYDDIINIQMMETLYESGQGFLKLSETKIGVLLPGNLSNHQARYFLNKYIVIFYLYFIVSIFYSQQEISGGILLKKISIFIYFFNPILEIVIQVEFSYSKSILGILSSKIETNYQIKKIGTLNFKNSLNGGFPLLYSSNQIKREKTNFYLFTKFFFFIWIFGRFLYTFFIVIIIYLF